MNTIAGWVLFGCASALGLSIVSGMVYKSHSEKEGYPVESADGAEGEGGAAAVEPIAARLAKADAAKGQASFAKCAACHTITSGGASGIGPNLWAALGKPHGHVAGFAYSEALKAVPGNWDFASMDAWLASPRKYAPGTKMTFAGLSDAQERANVIAYLNAQGSNLPLPAVDAAPAATEAEGNVTEGGNVAVPSNAATPATGAPSVDPAAAIEAEKKQ